MLRQVSSRTRCIALICGRCSKKVGGGFGQKGKTALAKMLNEANGGKKGRKAQILAIETKCLKLCPKGAVVTIGASHPGTWLLIQPGTPLDEVREQIGFGARTRKDDQNK
ncbi:MULTISPECIES: hypothetical protein [Sphingomonadaceae]|uniref:hypothetical protein n=1 Tax=Sphingomonadaceae TaxID=41297 RepID=UPI0006881B8F|nr:MULTISPECIES: hypothetical protein [Sphingomonadaceae]